MKYPPYLAVIFLILGALSSSAESPSSVPVDPKLEVTSVGSFDRDLQHWGYKSGELKGAKGALTWEQGMGRHGGAAKLTVDFSGGGNYVAMQRGFRSQATEFHFWIKAPECETVELRLSDNAKRTFQYTLPLAKSDDWQLVTLRDFDHATGYWTVPTVPDKKHPDGVWNSTSDVHPQLPVERFSIMVTKESIRNKGKTATVWVDDVEIASPPLALVPPRPLPTEYQIPPGSIFGVNCHWSHSDLFNGKENGDPYDRVEYALPFVVDGGFGIVRDVLYQGLFTEAGAGNNPDDTRPGLIWPYQSISKEKCEANRKRIEAYLEMYSKTGVRVILCPFFLKTSSTGFKSLFEWTGRLAKKYPCIAGIEMHNEPSLRVFWTDTPQDYVDACREGEKIIKSYSPSTPVYVGCISHMWWKPGLKWLQDGLDHGLLDGADGISVHPYRMKSPPEGGSQHAADNDPNGFASETADWWGMIQHYNTSGKPLRLIFTEVGYSTGAGIAGLGGTEQAKGVSVPLQADYVSRLALLVFDLRQRGLPVEAFCWYDLKCDGEGDPADLQANFGMIDYRAQTPRPSYTAYSRIAKTFGAVSNFIPLENTQSFAIHPEAIKSMAWQRLSDGAILVAYWRLDQVTAVTEDFDAPVTVTLPKGFQAGAVEAEDLRTDTSSPAKFTEVGEGAISVPVRLSPRAAWIVIHPRSPRTTTVDAKWSEGLPASSAVPAGGGKARLELTGPRKASLGAPTPLVLTVDNTHGTKAIAGSITLQGVETAFTAAAGKTARVDLSLAGVTSGTARVSWYTIRVADDVVGRGGFTITDETPVSTPPPQKNP